MACRAHPSVRPLSSWTLLSPAKMVRGAFDPARRVLPALVLGLMIATAAHSPAAQAETYKVSLAELPFTPVLLEILRKIEAANPGLKFEVTVAPFPRSIRAVVEEHTADMQFPFLRPADESQLPFDVSAAAAFQSPFMIYENKRKPLDTNNLQQYKIETDRAHTSVFPFPVIGSGDIGASLRKVDAGRIDGFISSRPTPIGNLLRAVSRTSIAGRMGCWILALFCPRAAKAGRSTGRSFKAMGERKLQSDL